MATIEVPHNFHPRSYQAEFFSAAAAYKRWMLVWHRRAGKDKVCLIHMLLRALERIGTYWYFFPERQHAEKNLWDNLDNSGFKTMNHIPKELIKAVHKTQLKITLKNGSIIQLLGAQDLDKLVGGNPVGVVVSEYSLVDPRLVTQVLDPILGANNGWLVLNCTPRGRNWAYDLWHAIADDPAWYKSLLTVHDTYRDAPGEDGMPVVTDQYIDDKRRKGEPEDLLQQEYFVSWQGRVTGAIYADLVQEAMDEGRITDVPWDTNRPVRTAWDLGLKDSTVVLFYQVTEAGQIAIFDMIEGRGKGLDYYIGEVLKKKYVYSSDSHAAPHDLFKREPVRGKSIPEIARDLGIDFERVPSVSVQEGIGYARSIFGRCLIDRTRCARLVTCLLDYAYAYDEARKTYGDKPVHSWSSDCADAFRYMSLTWDLGNVGRMAPVTSSGGNDSVWLNADQEPEDYEAPRNRAGGFVSQGRKYTLTSRWVTDPVTKLKQLVYY